MIDVPPLSTWMGSNSAPNSASAAALPSSAASATTRQPSACSPSISALRKLTMFQAVLAAITTVRAGGGDGIILSQHCGNYEPTRS